MDDLYTANILLSLSCKKESIYKTPPSSPSRAKFPSTPCKSKSADSKIVEHIKSKRIAMAIRNSSYDDDEVAACIASLIKGGDGKLVYSFHINDIESFGADLNNEIMNYLDGISYILPNNMIGIRNDIINYIQKYS